MIVALTGHRSEDCEAEEIVRLKARVKLQYTPGITVVISGMANGLDLWGADEALNLGIDVWAARPWAGHTPRASDTELYERVIAKASTVANVTESEEFPGNWCYHKRNEWMVDHADAVMAYWNMDKQSGGTFACVKYAKKVGKPISNIFYAAPF